MSKLESPINPNGKQEIPKPSEAIIDTPISGPSACNCDQALFLISILEQANIGSLVRAALAGENNEKNY